MTLTCAIMTIVDSISNRSLWACPLLRAQDTAKKKTHLFLKFETGGGNGMELTEEEGIRWSTLNADIRENVLICNQLKEERVKMGRGIKYLWMPFCSWFCYSPVDRRAAVSGQQTLKSMSTFALPVVLALLQPDSKQVPLVAIQVEFWLCLYPCSGAEWLNAREILPWWSLSNVVMY